MKQKDIALIIIIAAVSGVASFFVSNKLFITPATRSQQVEVVDTLNASFQQPDPRYFNENSFNASQPVTDTSTNDDPFKGGDQ